MVAALYRRYRPETFAELIGQAHVTDPLSAAIRGDRVGHAYLFSGPRGCGKTTSARILARCLNCAEGPTPTPCGTCDSCVELSRDGGGSLDVVEIDAASHNGVDDARDLRERAAFAPARDRFKIFILDEAHMVTSQGFNALLKIVEEPPEHVKFIFATTEPDKVIGTIRSRTHHYPFRLIPPAPMLEYVSQLTEREGVQTEAGVLPLVIRAGGGSARDTLSILDQLIAGSETPTVAYEQAVALLGFTHAELLDDAVDALGARDASAMFSSVDRVIQSGQDPRRFVEDLLERLRDLIVVRAAHDPAALLHGVPQEDLDAMLRQVRAFGPVELSRAADVVAKALTDMTGATSPKVHLELMAARLLVPAAGDQELGTLARVERLERRIGVAGATADAAPAASAPVAAPAAAAPAAAVPPAAAAAPTPAPAAAPATPAPEAAAAAAEPTAPAAAAAVAVGAVSVEQLRDAWDEVLAHLGDASRPAWLVVSQAEVTGLTDDVLRLRFRNQGDFEAFPAKPGGATSPAEHLRASIEHVLGLTVKYVREPLDVPEGGRARARAAQPTPSDDADAEPASRPEPATAPPVPTPTASAPAPAAPAQAVPAQSAAPTVAPARPASASAPAQSAPAQTAPAQRPQPARQPAAAQPATGGWAVAAIPSAEPQAEERPDAVVTPIRQSPTSAPPVAPSSFTAPVRPASAPASDDVPDGEAPDDPWGPDEQVVDHAAAAAAVEATAAAIQAEAPVDARRAAMDDARYGEAVVREELGAEFLEEIALDGREEVR
ncbi:DNA polymerase III subunit gamma and tau [Agrococcus jejuensis]|uniref:DNA polymerase III subunit gamma and tau n=1 Tax=Agrococcus jejuensis TaxID=399736 RepID=UPI00119F27F1|nr:DNA polymerase III subunit gamma and tau [Agrococcus jejuensis]